MAAKGLHRLFNWARWARLAALVWIGCLSSIPIVWAQAPEIRIALVIGNSNYTAVSRLPNPQRDAEAMAQAFREAGFQTVQVRSDLGSDAMRKALRDFSAEAEKADWAVVYYAGHGIEVGGQNYLIPVDARLKNDRDVQFEALPLEQVQSSIEGAKKLRLVILDACRDNPFVQQMTRTVASRSIGRGLARVEPEGGTLVAYAAKAGQVASDGEGQNSPFVSALVKHIRAPGLEINMLFRAVRDDVLSATGRQQEPFVYGSLPNQSFYFSQPSTPLPGPISPELGQSPEVALIGRCDELAASPGDLERPRSVAGIPYGQIEASAAIAACQKAVQTEPHNRRVLFQLGRSFDSGGAKSEAKVWYEKAAALGHASAMTNLGILYDSGKGGAQDHAEARRWYEKAAALGDATATNNLATLYADGQGVVQDYAHARRLYEKAAERSDMSAMQNLGSMFLKGKGIQQNFAEAYRWFDKAASLGSPGAMNEIGQLYEFGQGVPQNPAEASRWFERAAVRGEAAAMTNLGTLYSMGKGVRQDYAEAARWFRKASGLNDARAMHNLAVLHENGWGVEQNYTEARRWYERAASLEFSDAMFFLGGVYGEGKGVPIDYGRARYWYEKAANLGNGGAMNNLGVLFATGRGVRQDHVEARRWYSKAAALSNADAMNNLGWYYHKGLGGQRSEVEARRWYEKAAALGNEQARRNLASLRQ